MVLGLGWFFLFVLFVVLVFSFNVAILKLSCSYTVMKCLARSLYKTVVRAKKLVAS